MDFQYPLTSGHSLQFDCKINGFALSRRSPERKNTAVTFQAHETFQDEVALKRKHAALERKDKALEIDLTLDFHSDAL